MQVGKPEVVGLGGVDLRGWTFEDPRLDGPGAIADKEAILDVVSDAVRYVMANSDPLSIEWVDPINLRISFTLEENVDYGWVEWMIPITAVLEQIADAVASGEISKEMQRQLAMALDKTAKRIRSGAYGTAGK